MLRLLLLGRGRRRRSLRGGVTRRRLCHRRLRIRGVQRRRLLRHRCLCRCGLCIRAARLTAATNLLLLLRQLVEVEEVARPEGGLIHHHRDDPTVQLRHERVAAQDVGHLTRSLLSTKHTRG